MKKFYKSFCRLKETDYQHLDGARTVTIVFKYVYAGKCLCRIISVLRKRGLKYVLVVGAVCGNPTQRVLPHPLILINKYKTYKKMDIFSR